MTRNQTSHFVLIVGASGSGKTTITKALERLFPLETASFHYFDKIGIPSRDEMIANHGSTENWQVWATRKWLDCITKIKGKKLIVLEGSFYPKPALSYLQELGIKNYSLFCIHANRKAREERLRIYRKQPELITQGMENYAQVLKQHTLELRYTVIDSSFKKVEEVAAELYHKIQKII